MQKKKYETPKVEITIFESTDVILASGNPPPWAGVPGEGNPDPGKRP